MKAFGLSQEVLVPGTTPILVFVILVSIALIVWMVLRPSITATRAGKMLAFVTLVIFPVVAGGMGVSKHVQYSKSTDFCLSCHVMEDYGKSLRVDDRSYLPATHFQYNLIPRDQACFTCHTSYAMFGNAQAKMRGLKHVYKYYIGTPADPIKLYEPYNNRECLHCHLGARGFEEGTTHTKEPEFMAKIKRNEIGCTTSGCHNIVHNVKELKDAPVWKEQGQ